MYNSLFFNPDMVGECGSVFSLSFFFFPVYSFPGLPPPSKTNNPPLSPVPSLSPNEQPTTPRDMSLENILLDGQGRVKIIDFGMALMVDQPQRHQELVETHAAAGGGGGGGGLDGSGSRRSISPTGPCGKKHYMAPEVAMNERAFDGFAVDVWACGVILFM